MNVQEQKIRAYREKLPVLEGKLNIYAEKLTQLKSAGDQKIPIRIIQDLSEKVNTYQIRIQKIKTNLKSIQPNAAAPVFPLTSIKKTAAAQKPVKEPHTQPKTEVIIQPNLKSPNTIQIGARPKAPKKVSEEPNESLPTKQPESKAPKPISEPGIKAAKAPPKVSEPISPISTKIAAMPEGRPERAVAKQSESVAAKSITQPEVKSAKKSSSEPEPIPTPATSQASGDKNQTAMVKSTIKPLDPLAVTFDSAVKKVLFQQGLKKLAHSNPARRMQGLEQIVELSQERPELIPYLYPLLNDVECAVRAKAIESMIKLNHEKCIHNFVQALSAGHVRVRLAAIRAIYTLAGSRAPEYLSRALNDPNPNVRERAATYLGRCGSSGSYISLKRMASSSSSDIRLAGLKAFAESGDKEGFSQILQALTDPEELVRLYAAQIVKSLTGKSFGIKAEMNTSAWKDAAFKAKTWWAGSKYDFKLRTWPIKNPSAKTKPVSSPRPKPLSDSVKKTGHVPTSGKLHKEEAAGTKTNNRQTPPARVAESVKEKAAPVSKAASPQTKKARGPSKKHSSKTAAKKRAVRKKAKFDSEALGKE